MNKLEQLKNSIQELSALFGPSGHEKPVRDYLIEQIRSCADYRVDALGNLIVEKKGRSKPTFKVMLDAHMDEVGIVITSILANGLLRFETIGGITVEALFGKQIDFGTTVGVVGGLPMHLLSSEQKGNLPEIKDLFINIGCTTKEQAEELVGVGSVGVFRNDFQFFGNGLMKGKALDDRVGCAILLQMIQSDQPYDLTFTFTVNEENGLIGARTAAFQVQPDIALVLETTTAADVAGTNEMNRVCALGEGAVVSFMDRATLYHQGLYEYAFKLARRNNLPIQSKNAVAGGNNAGGIHASGKGIPTVALSLPCRYLHSASCVIQEDDLIATAKLAKVLAGSLAGGDFVF